MRYIFCVIFPPLAVLSTGRFFQFFFSLILTAFFWIPGMIHAFFIVNDHYQKVRLNEAFDQMSDRLSKNNL